MTVPGSYIRQWFVSLMTYKRGRESYMRVCVLEGEVEDGTALADWLDRSLVHCCDERASCRFLVEVVSRVDAGLLGIQNGRDLAMRCFHLCGEVLLMGL